MKKIIILSAAALVAFSSCANRNSKKAKDAAANQTEQAAAAADTHNSRNSLDFEGVYTGTMPCADCPGIKVNVTIDRDGNWSKTMAYLDTPNIFASQGIYTWDDSGSRIMLTDGESTEMYSVGENTLTLLDQDGNEITGDLAAMYVLNKQQ